MSEPTAHDLALELRDALGLLSIGTNLSPKEGWEEAIRIVKELVAER